MTYILYLFCSSNQYQYSTFAGIQLSDYLDEIIVIWQLLLFGKSFSDDKNKAETLLQNFSLFCYIAVLKFTGQQ